METKLRQNGDRSLEGEGGRITSGTWAQAHAQETSMAGNRLDVQLDIQRDVQLDVQLHVQLDVQLDVQLGQNGSQRASGGSF